jgi:D-alanyl-D-alanine dipeptidase
MLKLSRRQAVLLLTAAPFSTSAAAKRQTGSEHLERRVGQYGTPATILTVYEKDDLLYVDGPHVRGEPVTDMPDGSEAVSWDGDQLVPVHFEIRGRQVTAVTLAGQRLPRRDFGAEIVATIQAKVKADPATVRAAALVSAPPAEPPPKRATDLVDLTTLDPRIKLDVRYATSNNFMGFPLYERAAAYLQRPAAEALGRAQKALAAQGYGLMIHDGYRPWFVTKMFWDATPPEDHVFVADPAQGSRHNRGCAVDLTLYDLKTGKAVEMPSRYDEMSTRSYADFVGGTTRQRTLRAILRTAMEAQGFTVYPQEWWHFDYQDWASYGIGTATFTQLAARR